MAVDEQSDAKTEDWRAAIDEQVDVLLPELVRVREHLHAHPEPSGEEVETTRFLAGQFDGDRFECFLGPDDRGLIVNPRDTAPGARLALRADMDALRIPDSKDVAYRSQHPGVMHACGHDAHAAVVLGAVKALDALHRDGQVPEPMPWRGIFQPAEETNQGALEMMRAGALEGVDAILSAHVDPSRPAGAVGLRDGVFTADCSEVRIRVIGRGGHAARPYESRDPIATAAQLLSSIYLCVPRAVETHDPVVVTFGYIRGGDTANAIPDEVVLAGTLRTLRERTRLQTIEHIRKLARGLAEASDTQIDVEIVEGPPAVHNDPALNVLLRREATDLLGPDHIQEVEQPSMGGEDFANYLTDIPGAMFRLGCAPKDRAAPALHSSHFDIDPQALSVGAKILARAAVAWRLQQR